MVESNKNKGLFLGIAAATAVVGAALLYHFVFADEAEEDGATGIQAELEDAGLAEVKKHPNGAMLDPQYMLKLLNFVTTTARKRRQGDRDAAIAQRREAYKAENWDEYRDIIKDQFMKEDQMCQVVMREVLDHLTDTSEQEFQQTMGMMAQNPQYAQMIMAAQQGKLPSDDQMAKAQSRPKLEKAKTLKAFQTSKQLTMDAMKRQATQQRQPAQKDEMEMMIDMFVDQSKVEDALFIKEGIANDDLEESIMYFIKSEDADVKKAMTAYMMEMQAEMQKMGGGGMGMPGM